MNRLGDTFAGISWVTSAAILVQANLESEFINWLIKAIIAGAIAITGYYLRDTAKTIKETKKQSDETARMVSQHDQIIDFWVNSLGEELESRDGHIGRRRTDRSLANLVTAIRGVQERSKEGQ